jgi:hypothetical protein
VIQQAVRSAVPKMSDALSPVAPNPSQEFAEQARETGLVLPRPKRTNPWDVAAVTAVVVLVSLGVGAATGWLNLRVTGSLPPGLLGPQSCVQEGGNPVDLRGSISADADPLLSASAATVTDRFSGSYGSRSSRPIGRS